MSLVNLVVVFIASAIELWIAIPIGFALEVPTPIICLVVILGAITGVTIAAFIGDKVRSFIRSKRKKADEKPNGRIYKVWEKYGVVGYGLLAPALTGAVLGSAIGVGLGIERRKLILWLSVGVIVWVVGLSAAASLGLLALSSF